MPECRIYFIDFPWKKIYWFDHKTKERIEHSLYVGIAGWCINQNREINIENGYNDEDYNDTIDLKTTLPIHCRPIWHPTSNKIVIGCVQMVNRRGIIGWSVSGYVTMNLTTNEILEAFCY